MMYFRKKSCFMLLFSTPTRLSIVFHEKLFQAFDNVQRETFATFTKMETLSILLSFQNPYYLQSENCAKWQGEPLKLSLRLGVRQIDACSSVLLTISVSGPLDFLEPLQYTWPGNRCMGYFSQTILLLISCTLEELQAMSLWAGAQDTKASDWASQNLCYSW